MARLSPRSHTAAYLIWCDCKDHGWERTVPEIAQSVGMQVNRVSRILALKQWQGRVRKSDRYDGLIPTMTRNDDDAAILSMGALPRSMMAAGRCVQ